MQDVIYSQYAIYNTHTMLYAQRDINTFRQPKHALIKNALYTPLSDIFFWDPHDITRYFAI